MLVCSVVLSYSFLLLNVDFVLLFLQIDENVQREIINHRSLRHPNIIRFKEVCGWLSRYHLHGFREIGDCSTDTMLLKSHFRLF